MPIGAWPAHVDDSGNGISGTVHDTTFFNAMKSAIETEVQIPALSAVSDLQAAAGSKVSLDARLDVSLNEDGTLKAQAVPPIAGLAAGLNLLGNDTFLLWSQGDTSAPDYWALSGAGATITRTGSGLLDTTRKWGRYAAKLTSGAGASGALTQTLVDGTSIAFAQALRGRRIAFGARVLSGAAGVVSVRMHDGVNTTASAYHSGGLFGGPDSDGWEWLTGIHTVGVGPTTLNLILQVDPSGGVKTGYFSGTTAVFDEIVPVDWLPALMTRKVFSFGGSATATKMGNATTGVKGYVAIERPGLIRLGVIMVGSAAPTGATLIVDINTYDGANYTSIYAGSGTQPVIAINGFTGSAAPDGTYARRCIAVQGGTTKLAAGSIRVDVDQIGSGVAGADLSIDVFYDSYNRPLDELILG